MTCPGCQRANQPHRRYCGGCGNNLEPVCLRCDFANDSTDHFCGGCGHALRASDEAPAIVRSTRPAPTTPPPLVPPGLPRLVLTSPPRPLPASPPRPLPASPPRPLPASPPRPLPASPPRPLPASPPRLAIASAAGTISRAELAELLAPAAVEAVALPQGSIDQDDLDRLFGEAP